MLQKIKKDKWLYSLHSCFVSDSTSKVSDLSVKNILGNNWNQNFQ